MVWGAYGELEIELQPASMRYGFPIVEGDEIMEGLHELEEFHQQIEQDHAGSSYSMTVASSSTSSTDAIAAFVTASKNINLRPLYFRPPSPSHPYSIDAIF